MNDRTLSHFLLGSLFCSVLAACDGTTSVHEEEEGVLPTQSAEALLSQPKPGVYKSSTTVSGFPLGKCGFSGTTEQRDSDLNQYNAPYVMAWADDYCLTIRERPEGCGLSRSTTECQLWKTQLMKIVFPMVWSQPEGCLTPNQESKLQSTSNMKSIDIGTVYATESGSTSGKRVNVGYFRMFRHNGNYQYEMVAYGSRQPFLSGPLQTAFPGRKTLDGIKLCFDKTYVSGLALPAGRTPLSCIQWNDKARASALFGSLATTTTAYGFYDPGSHGYCPVDFAPRP